MRARAALFIGGAVALLIGWPGALAQDATNAPPQPVIQIGPASFYSRDQDEHVAIGRDLRIPAGTKARSVLVIAGNAEIDGEVRNEVVVIFGGVRLGPTSRVGRELFMVGGPLQESPGASIGSKPLLLDWEPSWGGLSWMQDWVRHGLFLARPLPHQHAWAWMMAGLFLVIYLLTASLLPRPLEMCRQSLEMQPGATFVVGLLAFLLLGPLLFLLVISVFGILIIPFLVLALLLALLIGKAAVYQFAGCHLGEQLHMRFVGWPMVGLIVGCAAFFLLYAVPLVGALVWGLAAILSLGAVLLAMFKGLRPSASPVAAVLGTAEEGAEPVAGPGLAPGAGVLELPRAGFWVRFWATALDALLVGVFLAALHGKHFAFLAWVVYHFAFWTWRGTTIGGIVMGIRIVRRDGRPINYAVALVRCVSSFFSALVLFLGFFWAGWDREKQSWHDKIAGTVVVYVPKASLL